MNKKKFLALLLAAAMGMSLTACGGGDKPAADTPAPTPAQESKAAEPAPAADPMEELIAAAKAEGELVV